MRVLMTTDTVGGVWTFTQELAAGLLHLGCEIILVSFGRMPLPEQSRQVQQLSGEARLRYIATEAPLEWMPDNAGAYSDAEALLMGLCQEAHPDVLVLSQFCFGALPVEAAKIVVAHSDVLSWASAVGKFPLAQDAWLRTYTQLVQQGLSGADALVGPTDASLTSTAAHFRTPSLTAVVSNGRTLPPAVTTSARQLVAISAGRMWDPAKNLSLLASLQSPIPIRIAGEHGESDWKSEHASLLGRQTPEKLLSLFRESAIYVCCSLYEPFGLAPLEAALCGCALLMNGIPSLREVWGEAALYFSDAEELRQLLQLLAEDADRLADAQCKALARAMTFTRERMAEGYLHLIEHVVAEKAEAQRRAA